MAQLNYTTRSNIYSGGPEVGNDIGTALDEIRTAVNSVDATQLATDSVTTAKIADGAVTADEIAAADAARLGLSRTGTVSRGKSIIATAESSTNASYGTLTTPDQVANIVLPTDGLIFVVYQAAWKESVVGAGEAALFLNSTQVVVADANSGGAIGGPARAQHYSPTADRYAPLTTCATGLLSYKGAGGFGAGACADYGSDASTGQVVGGGLMPFYAGADWATFMTGGPCCIFAAAGTYTVSVRFQSSSGSVTAKNRKLWVWTVGF